MMVLRQISSLTLLMSRGSLRQPLVYVAMAASPASYFLVLSLLGGVRLGRHALLGALVAFAVNAGIVSLPQLALFYRARRLQDVFVASPVSPLTYALGMAISRLVYVAPPLLVVYVLLATVSGLSLWHLVAVIPLTLLAWLTGSLLGFATAARWENPMTIATASNMLGVLLVMLPPVYYPLELLPPAVRWVALAIPTANVAELLRVVVGLVTTTPMQLGVQIALLLMCLLLCLWMTALGSRWRES